MADHDDVGSFDSMMVTVAGLDLFDIASSYASATVSHRRGARWWGETQKCPRFCHNA
jgi:hypothetical protein